MNALASEIAETLNALDPKRAHALERAIHHLLIVVRSEARSVDTMAPEKPAVDGKGWPMG